MNYITSNRIFSKLNLFKSLIHINDDGEIIIDEARYEQIQFLFSKQNEIYLEKIDGEYYKVTGIPPALEVMMIYPGEMQMIVLLQDHRVMFINENHRSILNLPSINRICEAYSEVYLLDINGDVYQLRDIISNLEEDHIIPIYSNISMLTFNPYTSQITLLTCDNQLIVVNQDQEMLTNASIMHYAREYIGDYQQDPDESIEGILSKRRPEQSTIIEVSEPIRIIVSQLVIHENGRISRIKDGKLKELFLIENIRDISESGIYIYVILNDNKMVKYRRNSNREYIQVKCDGEYSRFINYRSIIVKEDLQGHLTFLDDSEKLTFPYKLINIEEVEKRNIKFQTTKSAAKK